jgi:hypothetical protein
MSIALNVGGAPAGLEQDFASPAAEWTPVYWGFGAVLFNAAGGGSTETLVVDKGDLTLTGKSSTFRITTPVASAGLALTGQTSNFRVTMPVAKTDLTLSGQSSILRTSMPVTAATAALTGQLTAFRQTMPVTAGSLSLTGKTITFVGGGDDTPSFILFQQFRRGRR